MSCSSFGKCSGWWSCRSWVRVPLNSRSPQGFSPIFFCRYCSCCCCLTRGCTTMVRVTCPLRSKPGVDFGYLSTTWSFLGIGCRSSLHTVCVRVGVSVVVWVCTWVQILQQKKLTRSQQKTRTTKGSTCILHLLIASSQTYSWLKPSMAVAT